MSEWQRVSVISHLAAHLREGLERGQWSGRMPGVIRLSKELGAARNTVERALRELEHEGLLLPQGHGRGRVIAKVAKKPKGAMRVGILAYSNTDRQIPYMSDLQHRLEAAGNVVFYAEKCLLELRRELDRVVQLVEKTEADAWVVVVGGKEVLEWFAAGSIPAFAMFGRRRDVKIAGGGPDKIPAMREAVRSLVKLGHRRVVLLVRGERRKPIPGALEQAFLEELQAQGIATGAYNLPDWEESAEGLLECLDSLFKVTAPTALIFDEPLAFASAQLYLAQKGILTPRDVSMICCDQPRDSLSWLRPSMAHIRWDSRPLVRRIVKWANKVTHGETDIRQTEIVAEFVEGETVGPAR